MTGPAFLRGMASLETFFNFKLEARDRTEYLDALAALTDEQWAGVVSYAKKTWKYARVPPPASFLEWAGIHVESPAERAQRMLFDGEPVVDGKPLKETLDTAEREGRAYSGGRFWASPGEQLAYEYAAEEAIAARPLPKILAPEFIFGILRLISGNAQASIKKARKEE